MELELQNMLEIARLKAHPNTQLPQVSLKKMFCFFLWHMFLDTLRSSMLKFFFCFFPVSQLSQLQSITLKLFNVYPFKKGCLKIVDALIYDQSMGFGYCS